MKTRFCRKTGIGGSICAALLIGCANQSAQQERATVVQASPAPVVVAAEPAPVTAPPTNLVEDPAPAILFTSAPPRIVSMPNEGVADTNVAPVPAIEQRVDPGAPPDQNLSPAVHEIVKMVQAGVNEDVILTYIETARHGFNLNPDGIVYLNDLGVTANVITSMMQKDVQLGAAAAAPALVAPAAAVVQTQVVSNVAAPEPQPQAAPPPAAVAVEQPAAQVVQVSAPPQETEVSYFYDSLAPYGSWMYVSGYGWCWQPTVVVASPGWSPYCDAGRWYWSDAGWYWHSDYSWGWAPFHYGRWYRHGHAGWLWSPGTVWGPSWVSWRYSAGYCGWAPLPPAACWSVGVGFTYGGVAVGIGCDFGLSYACYSWVPTHRFCDYNVRRHCEPPHRLQPMYAGSTVINNYSVTRLGVLNHGMGRETVRRAAGSEMRTLTVRERPAERAMTTRPERLYKDGSQLVVERPSLPKNPSALAGNGASRAPRAPGAPVAPTGPGGAVSVSERPGAALSPRSSLGQAPVAGTSATGRNNNPAPTAPRSSVGSTGTPANPAAEARTTREARSPVTVKSPSAGEPVRPAAPDRSIRMSGTQATPATQPGAPAASIKSEAPAAIRPATEPARPNRPSGVTPAVNPTGNATPTVTRPEPRAPVTRSPATVNPQPSRTITVPSTPSAPAVAPRSVTPPSGSASPTRPAPSYTPAPIRPAPAYTPAPTRSAPSTAPGPSRPASSYTPSSGSPAASYTPAPTRATPSYSVTPNRPTPSYSAPAQPVPSRPSSPSPAPSYSAPRSSPAPAVSAPARSSDPSGGGRGGRTR